MSDPWTAQMVLDLAPDPASAKAGQGLARASKWATLGRSPGLLWGEIEGSGSKPYQVRIDLSEPAFRCSCPSRKFPCKHSLGLFLIYADDASALTRGDPPPWTSEWLAERQQHAGRRLEKSKQKTEAGTADPAAQAKRAAEREAKVAAGLAELSLWLTDLMRRGLAAAQSQPARPFEDLAAHMVDAQAPGIARLVRQLGETINSGQGWQQRALDQVSRLQLLAGAYQQIDTLSPQTQVEVRGMIGWTQSQDELLTLPSVRDHWLVLGQRVETEDRLRFQRTWLWGQRSGRAALVLAFAVGTQMLDVTLVPGTITDAELVYYPAGVLLRALVKERHGLPAVAGQMPGYESIDAALGAYAQALARSPWLERFAMPLTRVFPGLQVMGGDTTRWLVHDDDAQLPLAERFQEGWHFLAVSGGEPISVFGEWDGRALWPMSLCARGRFYTMMKTEQRTGLARFS